MKPENWIALGSVVVTAILTGVGLIFAPKLAVKRSLEQFQLQKRWELAHKDYGEITSCLIKQKSYAGRTLNHLLDTRNHDVISDDDRRAMEQVRHRLEVLSHSPFISEEVSRVVKAVLEKQDELADCEDDLFQATDRYVNFIEEGLTAIQKKARKTFSGLEQGLQ